MNFPLLPRFLTTRPQTADVRKLDVTRFLPLFTRVSRYKYQFARSQGRQRIVIAVHPKNGRFYDGSIWRGGQRRWVRCREA